MPDVLLDIKDVHGWYAESYVLHGMSFDGVGFRKRRATGYWQRASEAQGAIAEADQVADELVADCSDEVGQRRFQVSLPPPLPQ